MNTKEWLHKRLPFTALILALVLFVLSLAGNNAGSNTDKVALETADRIQKRLSSLEENIEAALETDRKELTLGDPSASGLYELSIADNRFDIPAMEDDQQLTLCLEVALSNGQILTDANGTWSYIDGQLVSAVG